MGLKKYTVKRIFTGFVTVILVLGANYFIFRLPEFITGTSPTMRYVQQRIQSMAQKGKITGEEAERIKRQVRKRFGQPPPGASPLTRIKYFLYYLKNMLLFNFGRSFDPTRQPVLDKLLTRLPFTLMLMGVATIGSIIIGIWLGVGAASEVGSKKDIGTLGMSLMLYSFPSYWFELLLIAALVVAIPIFPTPAGTSTAKYTDSLFVTFDTVYQLALPILALTVVSFGWWVLLMRNSLVDVINEDYIYTARAKGLNPTTVLYKHAFRNALLPVWTSILLSIASMWTGAIITESIFSIPGVGTLLLTSITSQNYPLEEMLFYFIALTTIGAMVIADVSYGLLDPRVKYD